MNLYRNFYCYIIKDVIDRKHINNRWLYATIYKSYRTLQNFNKHKDIK